MALTRHQGRWTPEDRFASVWQYLPVEIPPGAYALRVELEYDRRGAVLDLGCQGPAGFRGWSGGARRSFVITADGATPGYVPGELEPGTWQVIIGVHQVPPDGARYSVSAEVTTSRANLLPGQEPGPPPLADRPARRALPAVNGRRWLAGDLHTHTLHSDGALTVGALARLVSERGLDFAAVTDHNTVSHHAELPAASARHGVTLVPGQEVTTEAGHAGVLGDVGWVDFRRPADDWLAAAERGGGLMSINHPLGGSVSWTIPMTRRPPLAEIWHWSWLDLHWTSMLAWWLAWDPAVIPVGGSDWHRPGADALPGSPTTWVESASRDPQAIIDGLRAGRTAISASAQGPVLLRQDDSLIAIGADGLTLAGPHGPRQRITGNLATLNGGPGYHRLLDPTGATLALTG